jgi:hypothetical protein
MLNTSIGFIPPIQRSTESPISTISDFFWEYPAQETKSRLWQWYVDSVQNPEVNAGDLILFVENLIKLVDAASKIK